MDITITIPFTAEALATAGHELLIKARILGGLPATDVDTPIPFTVANQAGLLPGDMPIGFAEYVAAAAEAAVAVVDSVVTEHRASAEAPGPPPPPTEVPVTINGAPAGTAPVSELAPAPPSADAQHVDKAGTVWDPELHTAKRTTKVDGTWKNKPGRGSKAPSAPSNEGATVAEVATAYGALTKAGVDPAEIDVSVSQAVYGDMSKTVGGTAAALASTDGALRQKALNSLRAIAVAAGVAV